MEIKKIIATGLSVVLAFSMATACGTEEKEKNEKDQNNGKEYIESPYKGFAFSDYIELPDYSTLKADEVSAEVTDEEVDEEIRERLMENGEKTTVTKGVLEKGDKIMLSFKGTPEDGSKVDGISSEAMEITLGAENMIPGFQEGIIGKNIGEPFVLTLNFPDPYEVKPELAGKKVNFDINVESRKEIIPAELNDEFVKTVSELSTVEEYRELVKKELLAEKEEIQLQEIKDTLYKEIQSNTKVIKLPEDIVEEHRKTTAERYKNVAEKYEAEWDKFLEEFFHMDEEQYEIELLRYSREYVKQELIVYAIAEKENIQISQKEYDKFLNDQMVNSGYKDEKVFEEFAGMSLKEYVEKNGLEINLYLSKVKDKIYEKIS